MGFYHGLFFPSCGLCGNALIPYRFSFFPPVLVFVWHTFPDRWKQRERGRMCFSTYPVPILPYCVTYIAPHSRRYTHFIPDTAFDLGLCPALLAMQEWDYLVRDY
jgi:hypothetical protein